jgi:hypothetical protein
VDVVLLVTLSMIAVLGLILRCSRECIRASESDRGLLAAA